MCRDQSVHNIALTKTWGHWVTERRTVFWQKPCQGPIHPSLQIKIPFDKMNLFPSLMCAHYEPSCSTGKSLFIFYESMYKYRDSKCIPRLCKVCVRGERKLHTHISGLCAALNTNFLKGKNNVGKIIFNGPNASCN